MLRLIWVSTVCLCIIKRRYTNMGLVYDEEKILVIMKDYHSDKCPPSTSVCNDLLFDFSSLFMTCNTFSSLFMTCYKQLTIIFSVFIVKVTGGY